MTTQDTADVIDPAPTDPAAPDPTVPDPTAVLDQPALTTSSGAIWLIVGGLISATAVAVLAPMLGLGPPVVAMTGIVVIVVLYTVMVLVRLLVRAGRVRLRLLAVDLVCIALTALTSLVVIVAVEWNVLG